MTEAIRCDGCGHFKAGTWLHLTREGQGLPGFAGQWQYDFCSLNCIVAFAKRQRAPLPTNEPQYCGVMAENLGRGGEEHGPNRNT